MLAAVAFPLHAAEGRSAQVGGWGASGGGPPDAITLVHEGPGVTTAALEGPKPPAEHEAERVLAGVPGGPVDAKPDGADAARTLWLRARERDQARAAAAAEHGPRDLVVDGSPTSFAVAHASDGWAAVADVGPVRITVTSTGVPLDEVRLRVLTDPAALDRG